jgi:hypothetical protein
LEHNWEVFMRLMRGVLPLASVLVLVFAGTAEAHQATCEETTNPHGQTVPPAGQTEPGTNPKSGQNPDGFYVIGTTSGEDVVFVEDSGSGTIFGPFAPGTKIKYTQAPGGEPGENKIGSTNGEAGAVFTHITGTGDAFVFSSNGVRVPCLVPPPPK